MAPESPDLVHPQPIWRAGGVEGGGRAPVVLAIGGSDSGGGAGVQADLKALAALGVHGTTAITALTAQNTRGVLGVLDVDAAFVAAQIDAVVADIGVDAVKTGMMPIEETVEIVAVKLAEHGLERVVVDPVLKASTGASLAEPRVVDALKRLLLPRAAVVTPNLAEASALAGMEVVTLEDMREAARRIHALGARFVVVTGGHLEDAESAVDVLYDGVSIRELRAPRLRSPGTHGTGCTFAAAIAGGLALGMDGYAAVEQAKALVTDALRYGLALGSGPGPVNGLAMLYKRAGLISEPSP